MVGITRAPTNGEGGAVGPGVQGPGYYLGAR